MGMVQTATGGTMAINSSDGKQMSQATVVNSQSSVQNLTEGKSKNVKKYHLTAMKNLSTLF